MDGLAFVPLSLSDDEGFVAAVVFVLGCNFRCPFCHNADLVLPERADANALLPVETAFERLGERAGFLDSVVFSGGEPTLEPALGELTARARRLGLRVKLDTNGSRPEVLARLLEEGLVDYVAMDLKAPLLRYREFVGVDVDLSAIRESARLLQTQAPDYEFRTTVAPGLGEDDVRAIAESIPGARRYVLQPFRAPEEKELIDPAWAERGALSAEALRQLWPKIAPLVRSGGVRG